MAELGILNPAGISAVQRLTSIARVLGLPDPLLNSKWICSSLPFGMDTTYVESVSINFNNLGVGDKVPGGSTFSYYPSTSDCSAISVVFYEDRLLTASKFINNWKKKVRDPVTGFYGLPLGENGYKKEMKFILMDSKNTTLLEVGYTGCWPSETTAWSLAYTDAGRLTLTQNFSVDGHTLDFKI